MTRGYQPEASERGDSVVGTRSLINNDLSKSDLPPYTKSP